MENKFLDLRYACIHGFYWMVICSMTGYASVFLLNKGYSNAMVGIVLALANILAVVGQPVIASYMDKTTKLSLRMLVSMMLVAVIVISLLICFLPSSFLMIALITGAFTIMLTLQPFINSLPLVFEKHGIVINFGLARGIGSVAYAIISVILGNVVRIFSSDLLPFFYVGLSLCTLAFVYTFYLPGVKEIVKVDEGVEKTPQLSMIQFVKKYKMFMLLLVSTVFLFLDHSIINNFFIQVIKHVGGNETDMGNAIFIAAVLELPMMAVFSRILKKISCDKMMIISAAFFTVKHVITYLATNMFMIYVAQVTQMFAYAIFIPASVYYVSHLVEAEDAVKGQALITGAMTLGGVFASIAGGVMLDALGVSTVLLIGAVISAIGTVIMVMSAEKVD